MNDLQIFSNPEFGEIRALEIDGEPWFVGKDVARALGYGGGKSLANAVANHVDDDDKGVTELMTPGGMQNMTIINESGVYNLVFSSKLPKAKQFKRWVTSEVLPAIRKHGAYIAPQAQPPATLDAQAFTVAIDTLTATVTASVDTLTATVQALAQRLDAMDQGSRKPLSLPAPEDEDNPFRDIPMVIKPPDNKARRLWMRTASEKLDALAGRCGISSSSVLHKLYQELEDECGVILSEVRLKALEERQLTDCSFLAAIFYDRPLRKWFEERVDRYLAPETPTW